MKLNIELFYVIKVQDTWDGEQYITEGVYVAGPYPTWEEANNFRRKVGTEYLPHRSSYHKVMSSTIELND